MLKNSILTIRNFDSPWEFIWELTLIEAKLNEKALHKLASAIMKTSIIILNLTTYGAIIDFKNSPDFTDL